MEEKKEMKFTFKIQQYQTDAVEAVVDVFKGQAKIDKNTYVRDLGKNAQQSAFGDEGYSNADVVLSDKQLLDNIKGIQRQNNIIETDKLFNDLGKVQLDVEMETGTGKTYVYIKTMYELNKRYGWSKFIVVVPSIAIREGVANSFKTMEDHFMQLYKKKARYFIYSSSNLQKLDDFSSDSGIQVMIINAQAFAKDIEKEKSKAGLIIYSERDDFGSRKPIDVISANNPIIILDEPQKLGGKATQKGLKRFKPLFTVNYSATHREHHDLVYVLDALDAYNKKLVKRIEVKGIEVKNLRGTSGYIYIDDIVLSKNKPPQARIEYEKQTATGIKRVLGLFDANSNNSIYDASGHMTQYKDMVISDINPFTGEVSFLKDGLVMKRGELPEGISDNDKRTIQIRETIKSHFEKERNLFHKGIKVLSLFFIDEVKKYKDYEQDDEKGVYQKIFEEQYNLIRNEYLDLTDPEYTEYLKKFRPDQVHNGYFSIDKKSKHFIDSKTTGKGDTADGEESVDAYELILKNKERLLSFDEPTRFIFSHSALREGWDNPNVFQICTLRHTTSNTARRQEVGRGMRLCVDKNGIRMDEETLGDDVQEVNQLTVIADEAYESFAAGLQKDIKDVLYDRPTKATEDYFRGKIVVENGMQRKITDQEAHAIYRYLLKNDYIDDEDNITPKYHQDVENHSLAQMPDTIKPIETEIHKWTQAIFDESVLKSMVTDGGKPKVQENKLIGSKFERFKKLWDEINHKYAYTVEFDSDELIKKSVKSIKDSLEVAPLMYTITDAKMERNISKEQINTGTAFSGKKTTTNKIYVSDMSTLTYDLVGQIADATLLSRRTVVKIMQQLPETKIAMFRNNPEDYIKKIVRLILAEKATMIVDHITYNKTQETFDSEIFTQDKSARDASRIYNGAKSITEYVYTDGMAENSVEKKFAEALDASTDVDVYAKLPKGFYIPTPVGKYSPDWAVAFKDRADVTHIYFIAETKGSMDSMELRKIEDTKIKCATKCFADTGGKRLMYHKVDSFQKLLDLFVSDENMVKKQG